MLQNGLTHTCTRIVEEHHLAAHVGSGDLRVLSTPSMIALMEEAAMHCVAPHIEDSQTTVGGHIAVSHLKPTTHGRTITATATLIKIEGRKLQFSISASDEEGLIGEGEHTRFIVDREKFMARALVSER
jgi:predicted thioesterase